jgi:hypothetical protein
MAQPALHAVANHRRPDAPIHDEPDGRCSTDLHAGIRISRKRDVRDEGASNRPRATPDRDAEVLAAAHAMDLIEQRAQADSLERPLRRRDDMIERPARVRMRRRKPCFLERRRLFGWNVRLLTGLPHDSGGGPWCWVADLALSGAGRWCDAAGRRPPLAHRIGLVCEHAAGVAMMTTPRYGGTN